jgi:hypothetical protein
VATVPVVDRDEIPQHEDLLLVLSRNGDREIVAVEKFLLSLLLEESLLDLGLLLLADLHHHFFHTRVHLLSVLVSSYRLTLKPCMLGNLTQRNPLFGVRVQHFFYEI